MQKIKETLESVDPIVHFIFLIAITFLLFRHFSLFTKATDLANRKETSKEVQTQTKPSTEPTTTVVELDDFTDKVNELISAAVATLSAVPKTVVNQVTEQKRQVTFIPLGSTAATTSTDWVDIKGSEVYINANTDYGKDAYIEWEIALSVAHGNGTAFARLYDDTNKIAVNGSELSVIDSVNFKQIQSGRLNLWEGRNLYKIQLKSLNSFEIQSNNARVKVTY